MVGLRLFGLIYTGLSTRDLAPLCTDQDIISVRASDIMSGLNFFLILRKRKQARDEEKVEAVNLASEGPP